MNDVARELVDLARIIARLHGYPVTISGCKPLDDYEHDGQPHPGLRSKYVAELLEFRQALTRSEPVWRYSEAADLLYYAAQISTLSENDETYHDTLATLNGPSAQIAQEEAEAAALAKYRRRASLPNRRDAETAEERREREVAENAAIWTALLALAGEEPLGPGRWSGWPLQEVAEVEGIPVPTLHSADIPKRIVGGTTLINLRDPRWRAWRRRWRKSHRRT